MARSSRRREPGPTSARRRRAWVRCPVGARSLAARSLLSQLCPLPQIAGGDRVLDRVVKGENLVETDDLDRPDHRPGVVDHDPQRLKALVAGGLVRAVPQRAQADGTQEPNLCEIEHQGPAGQGAERLADGRRQPRRGQPGDVALDGQDQHGGAAVEADGHELLAAGQLVVHTVRRQLVARWFHETAAYSGHTAGMGIDALVFDFDGLLMDTETTSLRVWQYLWRYHGLELDVATFFAPHGGDVIAERYAALAAAVGPGYDQAASHARRLAYRDELHAALELADGIPAWLDEARELGLRLAVASSSPRSWTGSAWPRTARAPSRTRSTAWRRPGRRACGASPSRTRTPTRHCSPPRTCCSPAPPTSPSRRCSPRPGPADAGARASRPNEPLTSAIRGIVRTHRRLPARGAG